MAAANVLALVVGVVYVLLAVVLVSAGPHDDDDEASLATRTLLSAAVFDGRVVGPAGTDGRLLFRVRRAYKDWWHREPNDRRVTRLVYISCR